MRLVDTNVLLYAVSTEPAERAKHDVAVTLLEADDLAVSVQVLQEFFVQATRSSKPDRLSHAHASLLVESFLRFPVQETTVALLQSAAASSELYRIHYWDAAVLEAARALGCTQVLSEDLAHDQDYGGVRVVNPFRSTSTR